MASPQDNRISLNILHRKPSYTAVITVIWDSHADILLQTEGTGAAVEFVVLHNL